MRRRLYEAILPQQDIPATTLIPQVMQEEDFAARIAGFNAIGKAVGQHPADSAAAFFDTQMVPELQSAAESPELTLNLRLRAIFALRRAQTPAAQSALATIANLNRPAGLASGGPGFQQFLNDESLPMNSTNHFSRGMLRFTVISLLATICRAATEQFTIIITPPGGGYVLWQTSTPVASGSMGKTGSFTFDKYALVDLTFEPNTGYTLGGVLELTEGPVILDSNNHAQFGPVDHSPTFIARFNPPTPTGVYVVSSTNNALATVIGDISGVYSGTTPLTLTKAGVHL